MSAPGAGVAEYEALRHAVADPEAPQGPGLALVLARGLPAWLAALTALGPPPPRRLVVGPADPGGPPPVLPARRRELTAVLAGMILACARPLEAPCPAAR